MCIILKGQASLLTILVLGLNLSLPLFGVLVPGEENSANCLRNLAKLVSKPLAPEGNSLQEGYFRTIDEVAEEFANSKKFKSPVAWRKKTGKSGLQALDMPEEVGGKNLSASQMLKIFEYAGRYDLNLRDVPGGGHGRALMYSKNPEHKKIMEQIAKGRGYMAIAITEPEHGTDIRGMRSVAKKVEGGYELTGEKEYQARLSTASHIIILTQAPGQEGERGGKLNAFVVPKDYPGLKFKELETPALQGNSFGGVSFENLFIPESFRIGEDGEGGRIFNEHFTYWRMMQTSAALGTAKRALELMADRMRTREVNGRPIGSMTHLQQKLGRAGARLEHDTAALKEAAEAYDRGDFIEASRLAASAKALGVDDALDAVEVSLEAHGAFGMSNKIDLTQRKMDLSGLKIADGTADVLISDYVRKTFGQEFWDMGFGARKQ